MEKINVAELLKDCPKGMELYSPLCGDCTLKGLKKRYNDKYVKIIIETKRGPELWFNDFGRYFNDFMDDECLLFPSKENRDWSTFQRPFKDGDVVTYKLRGSLVAFIYKERTTTLLVKTHFALYAQNMGFCIDGDIALKDEEIVFATEKEKQKLFQAIKDNGYHWNPQTKTLEKLPKFKVGDRVRNKNYKDYIYDIYDITDKGYRAKEIDADSPIIILFGSQEDNYELVPKKFDINTLKPFESRVLVRDNGGDLWKPAIYGFSHSMGYYVVGGVYWRQCIPYKDNEYLLNTTNDCDEFYKTWEKCSN